MERFIGSNLWFGGQRVFGLTHNRTRVKPGARPFPPPLIHGALGIRIVQLIDRGFVHLLCHGNAKEAQD